MRWRPLKPNLANFPAKRRIDDDYNVINHYYGAKRMYPNMPFYLQDENGETYEFKWDLIYQYIGKLNE